MRKAWLTCLILVLIISALGFGASAEEYPDPLDSRNISEWVLPLIKRENPTAKVFVKAYSCDTFGDFLSSNIEGILAEHNNKENIVYFAQNDVGYSLHDYCQQILHKHHTGKIDQITYRSGILQEFLTMEAISAVSPDIVIESVYYLYGERHYDSSVIYYKTNLGDYVFYPCFNGLLFTVERYVEYRGAELLGVNTGNDRYMLNWDLSAYDYRSAKFDPAAPLPNSNNHWIGIAIFAVPFAAVVTVCVIRHKKNKQD